MELRTAAACRENRQAGRQNSICCERTRQGVYLLRDRHLVDYSAYCISYCTRTTGGTAYTVKYALEHGVTVYNASSFDVSALLQAQPLGKNEQEVSSHKI